MPLCLNVSSFDAAARSGTMRHVQMIDREEPLSRTCRNPMRPLGLGERRKRAFPDGRFVPVSRKLGGGP